MTEEGKNICFRDTYGFREKISILVDRGDEVAPVLDWYRVAGMRCS